MSLHQSSVRIISSTSPKRASISRSPDEWSDDDHDVLADGVAVGRIMRGAAAPLGTPWLWTLGSIARDGTATHGYAATRGKRKIGADRICGIVGCVS